MKRSSLILASTLALSACGRGAEDDFRNGVPTTQMVELKVPARSGQSLTSEELGQSRQFLLGEQAEFYRLTRGVTVTVNGATAAVLGLVKGITDNRPTSVVGDTAVWGPHTGQLSPVTWRFTVNRVGGSYDYYLEGKAKADPDTAFKKVLIGAHTPSLDTSGQAQEQLGKGHFLVDWDTRATFPEHDGNLGKAEFTYARETATSPLQVDVDFTQVKDDETGLRMDADYRYLEVPGQSGQFQFGVSKNMDKDAAKAKLEKLTIKSRWLQSGLGRSDVKVTGGDLTVEATANECWDANFLSKYFAFSVDPSATYGAQSSDCGVFTAAEYSSL